MRTQYIASVYTRIVFSINSVYERASFFIFMYTEQQHEQNIRFYVDDAMILYSGILARLCKTKYRARQFKAMSSFETG